MKYEVKSGGAKAAAEERSKDSALSTFDIGELTCPVDAIKALDGIAAATKFIAKLKEALKAFVNEHGPVVDERGSWGPRPTVKTKKLSVSIDEMRLLLLEAEATRPLIARVTDILKARGIDSQTTSEAFRWTKG